MKRTAEQALQDDRAKLEADRERKVAAIDRAKQRRAEAEAEVMRLDNERGEIVLSIARVDRALASLDGWQGVDLNLTDDEKDALTEQPLGNP